jgi:EKC/KEOPS complex subunit CGI121/TPRKB
MGDGVQVPATYPVLAAAHKALLAQSRDSLATRTLHSELIYNYSGSKHVSFFQYLTAFYIS